MNGVPSLKEELDRKVFETMEWLSSCLSKNLIGESEFSRGVDALFMSVNGLVSNDFMELITEAGRMPVINRPHVAVLTKDKLVYWITWNPGATSFDVTCWGERGEITKTMSCADPSTARERYHQTIQAMQSRGFNLRIGANP